MKKRCDWVPENVPIYVDYNNKEWDVPVHDHQTHLPLWRTSVIVVRCSFLLSAMLQFRFINAFKLN